MFFSSKEIVENDWENKIPEDTYNSYDYIDHIIRQVVGTDKTMLLTSFITHDFFNRRLMENGTFSTLIPRLIDVSFLYIFLKVNGNLFVL